ncbi:hypothetical protein MKX01_006629 [Papaver californicum]|nr:hypothetical protein MKX01_006629 [Papaver californicum]
MHSFPRNVNFGGNIERKALHEQKLERRKLEEISQNGVPYDFKPRTVKLNNGTVKENIENKNFDSKVFRRLLNLKRHHEMGYLLIPKLKLSKPSSIFEEAEEFLDLEEEEHVDDPEILDENGNGHGEGDVKKHSRDMQDAAKVATQALARRACTAHQLRKKLLAKGFSPYVIQSMLTDFYIRGFINDDLYAEAFARDAVAVKATKHVFEDYDSGEEMESSLGMSKSSMNHLFVQSSKQWLRSQDKRKARMTRWLQYRGFGWGVIKFILGKLESQNAH